MTTLQRKTPSYCWPFRYSLMAAAVMGASAQAIAQDDDPIKVGILHSLSGTMAISETVLKDTVEMLIEQQNDAGGLLGRQLEAVVVDPASNWPLFAERARELLAQEEVDVIFGNWTSVSRKAVLPVVEELNGLLFYPVQYEGEESSENILYRAPNEQAIPAVEYLINEVGIERFALVGTDYVYPRTTNRILEAFLKDEHGIAGIRGHHDQLHAVRPFRLAEYRVRNTPLAERANPRRLFRRLTAMPMCRFTPNFLTKASMLPIFRSSPSLSASKNSPALIPAR